MLLLSLKHCILLPTLDSEQNCNIQVSISSLRSIWCYSLFADCPSLLKWCAALQCQSLLFFNYLCKSICQVSLGKFCKPFTVQLSNFIWLLDLWVSYPRGRKAQWLTASRGLILGTASVRALFWRVDAFADRRGLHWISDKASSGIRNWELAKDMFLENAVSPVRMHTT